MSVRNGFRFRRTIALATALAFWSSASSFARSQSQGQRPAAASASQSKLQIQHDPLACVTTAAAPLVGADVNPGPDVAVGRVLWRVANTLPYFYYTVMKGTPPTLEGLLPRPDEKASALEYHIEAQDKIELSRKTPDYVAPVVNTNVCRAKGVVPPPGKGMGLTIGLTDPKAPPVPPGINKNDIAYVILVTGAVVTLAAALQMAGGGSAAAAGGAGAGAGGAGGMSTGLIVGLGVAAAAGIAVAASNSGGGTAATATPPPTSTATPTPTATATATATQTPIPNRFLAAEATWSGLGDVDINFVGPSGLAPNFSFPAGCDASGASRTERKGYQATTVPNGTYTITLTGKTCGAGTPSTITTLLVVQSESGPKCGGSTFVNVPVGQTVPGCTFTVP